MPTDKEKLMTLFQEFDIGFEENSDGDIVCETGRNKIEGYAMFYARFEFDFNDKFVEMGIWG